jgi:hypothetical protein
MGDFTDWNAVSLGRGNDGWWTVTLPIPRGIHEVNVRINGGSWAVPAGLPRKSDEFGSAVGVLIVEM